MHHFLSKLIWYAALFSATGYASVRGGCDERVGAAAIFFGSLLTAYLTSDATWTSWSSGALAVGVAVNLIFLIISLKTNHWWPLWATAFLIISHVSLFVPLIDPQSRTVAAYLSSMIWDYMTLTALFIGTMREAGKSATDRSGGREC